MMPHITVKAYPGKTEEQKKRLAEAIAKSVTEIFGSPDSSVSVAIEDVTPDLWKEAVYEAEITAEGTHLYKRPGYTL